MEYLCLASVFDPLEICMSLRCTRVKIAAKGDLAARYFRAKGGDFRDIKVTGMVALHYGTKTRHLLWQFHYTRAERDTYHCRMQFDGVRTSFDETNPICIYFESRLERDEMKKLGTI